MSFGRTFEFRGWNDFGDTEAWNGSSWATIAAGGGRHDPSPRGFASMAFDPTLSSLVLFGGVAHYRNPQLQSDTWRWAGTHWARLVTEHSPPALAGASFVYDTARHIGVLVGDEGQTWLLTHSHGGNGYLVCGADGAVYPFSDTRFFGSAGNIHLNQPIVGVAATPSGRGYWLAAHDGGIYTFGDTRFFGSTGNIHLNQPIVGMAATPSERGYWLVRSVTVGCSRSATRASTEARATSVSISRLSVWPRRRRGVAIGLSARDGGMFTFSNTRFYGSTGNIRLNQPIVGIAADPHAGGYWLVAGDGGVFAFGHAGFHGAVEPPRPTVAIAAGPTGRGYWIFGSDGHVQAFGDAPPHGDALGRIRAPIVGTTST